MTVVVNGWCWDDISSLWSTCANSDLRFIATVYWHSPISRLGREELLSSSPHKRSFLSHIVIWTVSYLRSMECKIDDINNIGSRGVSKPQARGREWWPLVRGSPLPHCIRHYQLWTQRTWRSSPPTLCSSLERASAVFKGANVSPSQILNRHFYTFFLIRYFWTKPELMVIVSLQCNISPWPGSRWSHMEWRRWGANPMGESFNYFLLNYHFYAEAQNAICFPGKFFCFHSATAANGAINCHYPSIKPPHWVIVTLPLPLDAF